MCGAASLAHGGDLAEQALVAGGAARGGEGRGGEGRQAQGRGEERRRLGGVALPEPPVLPRPAQPLNPRSPALSRRDRAVGLAVWGRWWCWGDGAGIPCCCRGSRREAEKAVL